MLLMDEIDICLLTAAQKQTDISIYKFIYLDIKKCQITRNLHPVITSFPDENNSAVVFGLAIRIVIAANLFLSYVVFGIQSAIALRSILPLLTFKCIVDTYVK